MQQPTPPLTREQAILLVEELKRVSDAIIHRLNLAVHNHDQATAAIERLTLAAHNVRVREAVQAKYQPMY